MSSFWGGPFTGIIETLRPTVANAGEKEWWARNMNPQPIDPLNQNTFDASQYGLQTNDTTFQPESGATLQEMLAEKEFQESAQPTLSQADSPLSFKYDQPEGVVRDYLGAGSPMLNEKGNTELDSLTNYGYDPAFGQLQNYYTGSTAYPGFGSRTGYFDDSIEGQEVPSLQRRLGNERFSLGEPQNLGFEEESETISAPMYQDRIRNRNLPGFAYEPQGLASIINSQLQNAKTNVGQKIGQGWDFAQALPGMAMSALSGIPGVGLLTSMFKESPEQKNFRDNIYSSPEYQNLISQIPGAENLNAVYGMGSGRGLLGALQKRFERINKTLKTKQSDVLERRRDKIKELMELERQKESEFLESQRRGRRPTAPDGGGTADQGGTYGGYSYDGGGRQGFGYGLKYGGRVGYGNGGLATLFTRRG